MPEIRVLMLTVSDRDTDLISALKAGARGYMLKNEDPEMLVQAIQYVAHGGILVSPQMAGKLVRDLTDDPANDSVVSERERPQRADERAGQGETGLPESTVTDAAVEGMVDLVISSAQRPNTVLKLHKWLQEVASADIGEVEGVLGSDVIMKMVIRRPIPLQVMLRDLRFVADVTDETPLSTGEPGGSRTMRLRLTLNEAGDEG
jgi:CheY-like chemotaxis protein